MHIKNINKKQVAAYALLPQVFPRFKAVIFNGFTWFAYLVAHIYYAVRLLPAGHPYLKSENQGKYGLRHVVAEAANNLKWDVKHIDQLLIFGIVITGIILLVGQILLLVGGFVFSQAFAGGLFVTSSPETDNAFMLLDYVFGVPGFFGSCALGTPTGGTIAPCNAIPAFGAAPVYNFHAGLHSLLEFYSWSILFVAVLIFLYFIVIIMAETASTGVPFGARFNTAWGPIRLLVAIGLLVPVVYGLNSGQYLTLAIAKLGSSLATNAWEAFNTSIMGAAGYSNPNPWGYIAKDGAPRGGVAGGNGNVALLPKPTVPDVTPLVSAVLLAKACEYAYMKRYHMVNGSYVTKDGDTFVTQRVRPYIVKPGANPIPLSNSDNTVIIDSSGNPATFEDLYMDVLKFYDYGDIVIRFGAPHPDVVAKFDPNKIENFCGEITIPTIATTEIINTGGDEAGAWNAQIEYFTEILWQWSDYQEIMAHGIRYAESVETGMLPFFRPCMITDADLTAPTLALSTNVMAILGTNQSILPGGECERPPTYKQRESVFDTFETNIRVYVIDESWKNLMTVDDLYELTSEMIDRGWAGAGMWYNRLAFIIGREFDAASSVPYLSKFPKVMDDVRRIRGGEDINVTPIEMFNPQGISDDESAKDAMLQRDIDIARTLYHVFKDWQKTGIGASNLSIIADADHNIIKSVMHGIFGTNTLLSIREEEYYEIHPMAQLIAIGKDLVNSTLTNVLVSTGFSITGGLYAASGASYTAGVANAISGALSTIALVGLTAGFVLYYVLPFMPFLYFFFGVITWIKTIFEAMVGVPLWALAHIRIDREGLPGDAAANGYFLLLEIFVRPILLIFSLVGSVIIFAALVRILHEVFELVVDNALGFDNKKLTPADNGGYGTDLKEFALNLINKKSIIDEFFFTIIYVITVYIIALSSFKLIDRVPDSILRWAGAGVKSFGDTYQDPAAQLTQYAAIGGFVVGERAIGGVSQLGKAMGQGAATVSPQIRNAVRNGVGGRRITIFEDEVNIIEKAGKKS